MTEPVRVRGTVYGREVEITVTGPAADALRVDLSGLSLRALDDPPGLCDLRPDPFTEMGQQQFAAYVARRQRENEALALATCHHTGHVWTQGEKACPRCHTPYDSIAGGAF